jgi:hypothetical protein
MRYLRPQRVVHRGERIFKAKGEARVAVHQDSTRRCDEQLRHPHPNTCLPGAEKQNFPECSTMYIPKVFALFLPCALFYGILKKRISVAEDVSGDRDTDKTFGV